MKRHQRSENNMSVPSSQRVPTRKNRRKEKSRTFKTRRASFETLEKRHLLAAQITAFTLMNDTGNPTDNQTEDAHVRVQMYNPTGFSHEFAAQFDLNMDGTVDKTVPLSSTATLLEYDLGPFINAGPITAKVRLKEYNYYTQQQLYTSWSTLNFVYTGDGIPDINVFGLVNDTGTPNDKITSDPRIKVAFGDGSAPQYVVEVDANNDGVKDLWSNSWPNNNAIFDLANLISPGQVLVKARVGAFSMQTGQYTFSGWDSFQFEYTGGSSGSTFKIDSLVLLQDTWIDGDKITSNPRVVLDFTVPSNVLGNVKVEFDTNGDGTVDANLNVAPDATVQFDPTSYISQGNINLKARVGVLNPQTLVTDYTAWSTLNYVYTTVFEPKLIVSLGSTALTNHSGMIAFGTAILNEPVEKVLTIKNDGLAQLTLDLNSFSATTGFSIPSLPNATLAAGASTQVTVRMNATTLGAKSGTLSFNSNDPNATFFDLSLAGEVVNSENAAPKIVNQLVDVLATAGQTVSVDISGVFSSSSTLSYSLVSISNPVLVSGSLQGTTLTLNAGAISGNSNITIRATTPNGLFTEDVFILNIVQAGQSANQTVTIDLSNGRTAQQIETELRSVIQNANANGFRTNILFTLGNQDRVIELAQASPIEILTHVKFFGPTDGYALTIKRVAGDQRVFTVAPNAKAEFSDLTIRGGRRAMGDGAGIWNAGELTLNRVTLYDNVATSGYGAGLFNASLATATLGNVTISGNQTQKWGAGIFNRGTLSADNVTFASNTAERGAAFFNEGTMNLFASLIADGVDGSHPHTELAVGTVISRGFNVVTNAYGTTGFSTSLDKLGGISGLPLINPGLRPLQNNGGASLTHALIANSPAIDIVSTTANDTLDQRGAPRIINTREQWIQSHRADAGAYEFGAFFVNVNADGTDLSTAGDGIADSNSTLAGDQISLRSAISEANELTRFNANLNISYDQAATYIYFHPSVQPTLSLPGSAENGNLTGDLDILGNVVLIGQGTTKTIVRADYRDAQGTAVPDRVFHIHPNISVRMESIRLRDGRADIGGGIFTDGATVELNDMLVGGPGGLYGIGGNAATLKGGGIYQKAGSLHLVDSSVVNNISLEGGGVYVESGTVVIEDDSHIDGNWAEVSGGGIAQIGGTIRVSASTIQDNSMLELLSIPNSTSTDSKRRGAGIYTMGASFILESESLLKNNKGATLGSGLFSNSTVQILSGSIVSNNGGQLQGSSIVSSQGGGVFNLGALSLVDSKVEKNLGHEGAGIYNLTPGKLDVIRSSVSENNFDIYPLKAGAGIYNLNGITKIESSTISKNEGVHDAGGVYNYGLNAHLIISNSTFQGNWAVTTGGGVRNDSGTVEVYNSLFLENFTPYASSGFGGGIYNRGQNVLLGRLASKIELYAAVNTTQTSLHVNNVDSLLPLPLPINVRLNSEVMRIVAIDRVKGTVQVERTAGQTHSVTTPLELVDYIGLRELDTLGNNKFPLDIVIDNEVMRATSIMPGTNWVAVERGRQNTEIESHETGALVHGISGSLTIANSTFSDNFSGVGNANNEIQFGGMIHNLIHPYVRPTVIESSTFVGNHRADTAAIFTEMLRNDYPGKVLTPSGSFMQLNPVPRESTGVIPVWNPIRDTLYLSNSVFADGIDQAIVGQVTSGGNNVVDQDKEISIPITSPISATATVIDFGNPQLPVEKTIVLQHYWIPNLLAPINPIYGLKSPLLPFKIRVSHSSTDANGNISTNSEVMLVTHVQDARMTVVRGVDGTTAIAHTDKVTASINASGLWNSTDIAGGANRIEKYATTLLAPEGLSVTADLLQVADSSQLPPIPFNIKVSFVVDNEVFWEEMAVTEVVGNYLRVTRDSGVAHSHLSKVVVFSTLQHSIDAKIQALTQTATDLYTHIPNADSPAAKTTTATVQAAPLQSGLAADYHPSFDIFLSTSTVSGNYTLSTTLDSESTTLFLIETGLSLSLPVFAKLDQEIIRLVQYSSATQSYVIERGLQGTQKKPHQANSRVTLGTLISADATDTSFSADLNSSLPPVPFIVAIGGELMNVTAVNVGTGIVQVQRGQFGSTRTTHPPLRRASTELTLNTEVIMAVTLGNNLGKASPLYRPWQATLTAEVNAQSQYIMVDSPPAAFEDYVAIDGEIFSVIRVPSDANKLRIISRGAFGSPTKNHNAGKTVEAGVVLALDPTVDATITAGSIVTRDGESMIVSAVFDDAMLVTRGALGTKAIDHPLSGSFNFGSSVDADDQYLLVRDSSTIKSFPAIAMVGNERILILEDLGYGILRVQRGIHGTTANPIISGMKAASGTLIQVGSSQLEIGSTIQVAQEQLQVRGFQSSTGLAVVERGTNGTLPASHQAGTFVHFGSASRPIALAGLSTALTAPVTQATQTSLTVGGMVEFPAVPFFAALGNERIRVDAVVQNSDGTATLQTVRNLDGSVGTAYAAGTNLVLLVDQNQWNRLKKATDPIYASPEIGSIATSSFVVNTTSDLADLSPGDGVVTTSVPGAVSLRAAIMEANALSQPVEIRLSGATYTLTSELEIRGDITLIGTSPTGTILQGNGQRIFKVLPNARLQLDSLTLTGGNSSTQGGAMLITGGSTEIYRTILSSNSANSGGAIAITAGTLNIAHSTFMNNTASTDGGALASLGGQTTLSYTTFSANTATGKGGAIYNATTGDLELRNATLAYNQSASGAGIHNLGKAKVGNSIIANQAYGQTDIKGTFTSLGSNIIGLTSSDVMLTSFVSSTSTTISLSNTQSLPAVPFSLRIGNETMTATSQSGSTFTVQRTNPLSHSPYQSVRVDGFWQTGDQTGSGYTSIDPKLQPLALGLGTVPTHALQSNSPAINTGNAALRLSQEVTIAEDETTEFAGFQRDFKVIKVTEAATLPATPFFVQIGTETLEVIAKKGNTLTVKERKFPQPHARGAVVKVLTDARGLPSHNDIGAVELETTISLSTANASLTEDTSGIGSQFTYTITRGGNVADRHEIYFVVNPSPNSRIAPIDFGSDAFPMGKVILEPGATSASFTISVATDTIVEPNEAFTVSILSPSAQVRKLVSSVTSTIVDNDTASVTTTAVTAVEGESLRYTVTLQGNVQGGLQLPWSLGAAGDLATLADNDYIAASGVLNFVGTQGEKQYIEAITIQDQKVERHESLSVTIGSNLGVAPEMVSRISVPATLVGTIQNDDRTTIYISEVSKTELNSGSASVSSGFTVWPNPVDTSLPLTLQVTSSNATLGSDYSVTTSTLTLPGTIGTQSSNVVSIVGDSTLETDEVVQIAATLTDRSAWSSFISVVSGKVTIVDDDGPTLAISDVIASESNGAGYIEFQVQLLNNNGQPLTIDLKTKDGTAIAGQDYQQTTRTLSFSGTSGETRTFQVPLLSENLVERDEWLTLEPVDPMALSLAGIRLRSGAGTIRNDDVADILISPPLQLDDQAWHFEIRLSNPVDVPVAVTMSSTDIMASPTNHFTPSTTTFNLMTTSDVGRLVVNYQPQLEAARNIQVAPVSVSSSGRPVNLPQSQNAAIPVHQANAGACRPVSSNPLAPPPNMQFSGEVPSGYTFAYEINGIRVYTKPHGRTVAYYETDKISQFTFLPDGHVKDEAGEVWDKIESHTEGYFLLKWFVFTVQMTPPPAGQPNPPGCGTPATPPANNNEEEEELLEKEIADPGKTADWVIPYTSPGFTFSPFSSDAMSDVADPTLVVTLYDGAVNPNNTEELKLNAVVYKPGNDIQFPNGKLHINQDRTLTFTPNGETGTLVPELNPAGHPYRLIDLNYFEVHLIDKSQLNNAQTSSITPYQSIPASVAVANHLPIMMGETTHAPEDGFYLDSPVFLDFLDSQEVDLRTLYTDPDGETDIDKLWIKSIYYSNNGNTTSDGEGTLRVQKPIGALVQYSDWFHLEIGRTEKYLIVEAQENNENKPHKITLRSEVSREDAQSSNFDNTRYPVSLEFQVELTDGSKITLEDGTEREYTWFTTIRVRPNVYTSEGMWKQKTGKPDVALSNWVSKLQPGIREFDPDAAINYTDINFTAEARNATTNSGIVDVNGVPTRLFDGSFMYGADIPLDAAGGTSELGLSGLIYDSSQVFVSATDTGSSITNKLPVIQGRLKIPSSRPLPKSAIVKLTWDDRKVQTPVPVSRTFNFNQQNPASYDMVFAMQGNFVPEFTGVYRWKMELVLSFEKPQNAGTESFTKEILGESIIVVGDQYNLFGNGWNLAGIPILWVDDRKNFQYETGDSEDDRVVILFPGEAPRLFNAHELIKNNSNFNGDLPSLRVGSNAIGSNGYRDSREFGNLRADGTNHYLIYKDQDGTEYFFKEQSYLQQKLYLIERIEQPGLDKANLPNNRKPLEFIWEKINNKPVLTTIKATDSSKTTINNLTQDGKVVSTTLETKNSSDQLVHRTILEYDTRGNLSKIRYADLSSNNASPSYRDRRFQYDADVLTKDEWLDGTNVIRTSSLEFDAYGALKSVTRGHNSDPTSVRMEIESALSFGLEHPQPREEMKASVNQNHKASVTTETSTTEASLGITYFYFNLNGTVRKEVTGLMHNAEFIPETTKSISYSPLNDVKAIEEEGGRGTYYWYDYEKQPKVFDANSTIPASSSLRGNVVRIIAPTGSFTYTYETDPTKQEKVGKLLTSVHKQLVDASGGFAIQGKQPPIESKYKYNEKGQLTEHRVIRGKDDEKAKGDNDDPFDFIERYIYDGDLGRLATLEADNGLLITYDYFSNGMTKSITQTDSETGEVRKSEYSYDPSGNTEKVIESIGTNTVMVVDYVLDGFGRVLQETITTDARNYNNVYTAILKKTKYEYSVDGLVTEVTDGNNIATVFQYAPSGLLTKESHGIDATIQSAQPLSERIYSYSSNGVLSSTSDTLSGLQTTSTFATKYDINKKLLTKETTLHDLAANYTIGSNGQVTFNTNGEMKLTETFDAMGRLVHEENSRTASSVEYVYDDYRFDTPTETRERFLSSWNDPAYQEVREVKSFDNRGNVVLLSRQEKDGERLRSLAKTEYKYDELGYLTFNRLVAKRGLVTEFVSSPSENITTATERGWDNSLELNYTTIVTTDQFGQMRESSGRTTQENASSSTTPKNTVEYQFDTTELLFKKTTTGDNGLKSITWYDALGREKIVKSELGSTTKFTYDAVGNLVSKDFEPLANDSIPATKTTYEYDKLNRPVATHLYTVVNSTNHLEKSTLTEYDTGSNFFFTKITERLFANNNQSVDSIYVNFQDRAGSTIATVTPAAAISNSGSNGQDDGLLRPTVTLHSYSIVHTSPGDSTSPAMLQETVLETIANATGSFTTNLTAIDNWPARSIKNFLYSPSGNLLSEQTLSIQNVGQLTTTDHEYDGFNRLIKVINNDFSWTEYTYDDSDNGSATGKVATIRYSNGNSTEVEYDSFGNTIKQVNKIHDRTVSEKKFTYDEKGRPLTELVTLSDERTTIESLDTIVSQRIWQYEGTGSTYTTRDGQEIITTFDAAQGLRTETYTVGMKSIRGSIRSIRMALFEPPNAKSNLQRPPLVLRVIPLSLAIMTRLEKSLTRSLRR
jgi:YD repeat-containing protein